ncbi:hypothetical protein [Actinomadura harenae]|uniref:Tat pathway signal sequence domain protein n=1 Tax=Actinomadura harenae TaxID=2483351 RepID=A0A3M2LWF0_9ACTN|nr:hypothetical protein [Actinomadura harenae]RMI40345.1 hypothetical protein EBO15_26765 [Actinomadura harenae]
MKRITQLATAAFAGAAVVLASTGTANADTGTTVITFEPASAAHPAAGHAAKHPAAKHSTGKGSAVKPGTIRCVLAARDPHSPRRPDAEARDVIDVAGSVKCDHPVARISIRVGLYKKGRLSRQSAVKTNAGKTSIAQNASHRCVAPQDYTGVAIANIVAPPGFRPEHAKGRAIGRTVRIAACRPGG